jgi:tRNA threonylcarbamoyladenosine biosynthesis protein TsaB
MNPDRPYILALDTAMQGCSVAVMDSRSETFTAQTEPMQRGQSERLVPMIDSIIAKAGINYADIGLIAVTVGPGAFTGLRIGLSTARALGTALDCPVAGITTLETLARQYALEDKGNVTVILETKREDFYVQFFNGIMPVSEPACMDSGTLSAHPAMQSVVIGDGAGRFIESTGNAFRGKHIPGFILPDPCLIAAIAWERHKSGKSMPAEPLYLRGADVSVPKKPGRVVGK